MQEKWRCTLWDSGARQLSISTPRRNIEQGELFCQEWSEFKSNLGKGIDFLAPTGSFVMFMLFQNRSLANVPALPHSGRFRASRRLET